MVPVDRRHLLPTLVVAYPATFVVLATRPHCPEGCPGFGFVDGVAVLAVVVGSLLVSFAVTTVLDRTRWSGHRFVRAATTPADATVVVLALFYIALVGFLALDAVDGPGGAWKVAALPLSLLPYAPVWALYAGTFYLAFILNQLGGASSPTLTLLVRATVVVVGFGATPVWQFWLTKLVVGRLGGR